MGEACVVLRLGAAVGSFRKRAGTESIPGEAGYGARVLLFCIVTMYASSRPINGCLNKRRFGSATKHRARRSAHREPTAAATRVESNNNSTGPEAGTDRRSVASGIGCKLRHGVAVT